MSTILLVSEHLDYAYLVTEMLRYEGFTLLLASETDESVRLTHEYQPDIILCDLAPERGGETIRQTLQLQECTDSIPFLYLTTLYDQQMPMWTRYIRKPFAMNDLLTVVGAMVLPSTP
jgi:CheY-like chemotaxis protein